MNLVMNALRYTLFLFLLTACSSCALETGHTFQIYEENGVTIAETTGGPKHSEEIFRYERILVLKEDPTKDESYLFNPGRITMDSNELIYVIDRGNQRIAVFNKDGEYLRCFGGEGSGPGEFLALRLLYLHNDILNLYDWQSKRATTYRTDGTLLEVITPRYNRNLISNIFQTPEGSYINVVYADELRSGGYEWNGLEAIINTPDGKTITTVASPRIANSIAIEFDGGRGSRRMEYSGAPVIQYYPGKGLLVTTGEDPVISWYDLTGTLISSIQLKINQDEITDEERSAIRTNFNEIIKQVEEHLPDAARAERKTFHTRNHKAFWDDAFVDDVGYIWLQIPEMTETRKEYGGPIFRIISPEGEYLGNTRWPSWVRISSGSVAQGCFLGYREDRETGERFPTIYSISSAVEGFDYP